MDELSEINKRGRLVLLIPVLTGIMLIILGILYFRYEKRSAERLYYQELRSIGKLKAAQISNWYIERSRDADYFSSMYEMTQEVQEYSKTGIFNRKKIIKILLPVIKRKNYNEILITTTTGKLLFSVDSTYSNDSVLKEEIRNVVGSKAISVHNIIYCPTHNAIHSDVLAPIIVDDSVRAVLILRSDPRTFLYPYIQEWPVPRETAETVLVGRKGDSAVFLNEMKKVPNIALRYTVPLKDTTVPAVMAILGKVGGFSGIDYSGAKVLSDLRMIDGTPWALVVKINRSEAHNEVRYKTILFGTVILMIIFIVTLILVFGYRRKQFLALQVKEKRDQEIFLNELQKQVDQRTAELKRSNDDLLSFAHVISHDMKEPVRKMKFLISVIGQNGEDVSSNYTYINRLNVAADRLMDLIDGVLKFAEVQNSGFELSNIDLNYCFDKIKEDLEILIENQNVIIRVSPLPSIIGYDVLIYQLFFNLIKNAIKFAKKDVPPVIIVDAQLKQLEGSDYIEIIVKDNGIGFSQEHAERIFKTFTRLHSKDTYEGSGIGLSLCKKIVERHKGKISATSVVNEGSTFMVLLPLRQ